MFRSIDKNAVAEIIEKKSKFIANVYPADNKDEAENILKQIRQRYHDAKHNSYAYIVENIEMQ